MIEKASERPSIPICRSTMALQCLFSIALLVRILTRTSDRPLVGGGDRGHKNIFFGESGLRFG